MGSADDARHDAGSPALAACLARRPLPAPPAGEILSRSRPAEFAAPISTWSMAGCPTRSCRWSRARIVGRVAEIGSGVEGFAVGQRIGVPWLEAHLRHVRHCSTGREKSVRYAAVHRLYARWRLYQPCGRGRQFCFPLPELGDDAELAPRSAAGLIGWRSYRMAGEGRALGLYGFGAAAHILAQVAAWQGRRVHAFTRAGDVAAQALARSLGAVWAGGSEEMPPEPLDAAIIFAPVGALVPLALKAVKKGGRVVCGGIHMSDIPSHALLWKSATSSRSPTTRADAREFWRWPCAPGADGGHAIRARSGQRGARRPREGRLQGAVLVPEGMALRHSGVSSPSKHGR